MSRRQPRVAALIRSLAPRLGRIACALPFAVAALAPRASAGDPDVLEWRREPAAGTGTAVLAVAVDVGEEGAARLAVGDGDGVRIGSPSSGPLRSLRLPGVTDLAFDREGVLWAATLNGLWSVTGKGMPVDRSPGTGEATRVVRRVAWGPRFGLVATGSGAFATADGRSWTRLPGPLSSGPVRALAIAPASDPIPADELAGEAFAATDADLWRIRLETDGPVLRARTRWLEPPPGRPLGESPVDLAADWPGFALVVLYSRDLALRREGEGTSPWRVVSLDLPPGASARRLGRAAEGLWIAHDRGLARARVAEGPWQRASSPMGRLPTNALAASGEALYAATASGLFVGRSRSPAAAGGIAARSVPRDPDIVAVQAAAIRYLDLAPARWRSRFDGLARRGWIPHLALDLDWSEDKDHGRDDDQAFVSGETRFLVDRDERRGRELGAGVTLVWDLPSLAYDDDWDDLSREVRQLIALRDDVLDEVNQLYFERRRVLHDLAARRADDAESVRLRLRAEELAAGIDAWTGGWFLAQVRRATPPEVPPDPEEENP